MYSGLTFVLIWIYFALLFNLGICCQLLNDNSLEEKVNYLSCISSKNNTPHNKIQNQSIINAQILNYVTSKIETGSNNVKYYYDAENRLNQIHNFEKDDDIVSFEIVNYKTLIKHDNGSFSSFLVLLAFKHKIEIYDIYQNLLAEQYFDFEINEIHLFHSQEEIHFYLLTDGHLKLRKYNFTLKKIERKSAPENDEIETVKFNNMSHLSPDSKIEIKMFKEESRNYNLSLTYKKNLQKYKWNLQEVKIFPFENKSKIKMNISQGSKNIYILTENNLTLILNENLEIVKKLNNNQYLEKIHFYQNIIMYIKKGKRNSIIFSYIDSIDDKILECKISDLTKSLYMEEEKISNFIFDPHTHLIYILLEDGTVLFANSLIKANTLNVLENTCKLIGSHNLKFNLKEHKTRLDILRKDLIIYSANLNKNYTQFAFIDLVPLDTESETNHSFKSEIVKFETMNRFKLTHPDCVTIRNLNGFYILSRTSDNQINLHELVYNSNKIKGVEDYNFNFKIPIVFIALIILFFYHYLKNKKTNNNENGYLNSRDEILKHIQKLGKKHDISESDEIEVDSASDGK